MRLLLASPFLPPFFDGELKERKTVLEILQGSGDLAWSEEFVAVRLNGITIPRAWWPHVTVKPEAAGTLELCVVPQKGNLLPILATVATIAAVTAISYGALGPVFGPAFAAGTIASGIIGAGTATSDSGIAELFALNQFAGRGARS